MRWAVREQFKRQKWPCDIPYCRNMASMFRTGHIMARGFSAVQRILPKMVWLLLGDGVFSLIKNACQPTDAPHGSRLCQNEPTFFSYHFFLENAEGVSKCSLYRLKAPRQMSHDSCWASLCSFSYDIHPKGGGLLVIYIANEITYAGVHDGCWALLFLLYIHR